MLEDARGRHSATLPQKRFDLHGLKRYSVRQKRGLIQGIDNGIDKGIDKAIDKGIGIR